MLSSTDILHQRLDLLESTYIGSAAGQGGSSNHSLIERVQALNARFSCLQEETPVFLACYDTAMKLRPLILEKKATVLDISQKVEGLIASKEVLQSNMKMILNIDDLCSKQRNEDLKDVDIWTKQLANISNTLAPLISEAKMQSEEVDELLDLYEQAMAVMSDVCCSWEEKLKVVSVVESKS